MDKEYQVNHGMLNSTVWVGTRIDRHNAMVAVVINATALLRNDIGRPWVNVRAEYERRGWLIREKS